MIYFQLNVMHAKSIIFLVLVLICHQVVGFVRRIIPIEGSDDPFEGSVRPCNVVPEDCPTLCTRETYNNHGLKFPPQDIPGTLEKPAEYLTYICKDLSFEKREFYALQIRYTLKLKNGSTFPKDRKKTWFYDKKTKERILYEPRNMNKTREDLNNKREDLNNKREDLNDKREYLTDKREDFNGIREDVNDKRENFNTKREDLNIKREDLNIKREDFNTKREDLNDKREDMNKKREALNDKREALNDKREALNDKREALIKKGEDLLDKRKDLNDKREDLNDERENLNDKREEMNEKREGLSNKRENFNDKREDFNSKREDFNSKREDLNDKRENLNDKRENINDKREDLNNKREDFNDKQEDLNDKRDELNTKREDLNDKREDLNDKRKDLNDKRKYMNDEREDLNDKREDLNDKREDFSNKREELNDKREDVNSKREDLNDKREDVNGKREDLNNKREDFNGKREDFNDKREDLNTKRENFNDKREDLNTKRDNLNDKREDLNNKRDDLNDKREDLNNKHADMYNKQKDLYDKQEALRKSKCEVIPEDCPSLCKKSDNPYELQYPTLDFLDFLEKPPEFGSYICKDSSFQEGEFYALQTIYTLKPQKGSNFPKQKRKTWFYDKQSKRVILYGSENVDGEAQTMTVDPADCKNVPDECPSLCTETNVVSELKFPTVTFPAILEKPAEYITYICKDPRFQKGEFYALQIRYSKLITGLVPARGPVTEAIQKILYYNKDNKKVISYEPKSLDKLICRIFPDDCPSLCKRTENVSDLKFPTQNFPALLDKPAEYTTYICRDPRFQQGEFYALQIRYNKIEGLIIPPRRPPAEKVMKTWYYDKQSKHELSYEPKHEVENNPRCPVFPENCPLMCRKMNNLYGIQYPTIDFPEFLVKPREFSTYVCMDASFQEQPFVALQTRYIQKPPKGSTVPNVLKKTWYYDTRKKPILYVPKDNY